MKTTVWTHGKKEGKTLTEEHSLTTRQNRAERLKPLTVLLSCSHEDVANSQLHDALHLREGQRVIGEQVKKTRRRRMTKPHALGRRSACGRRARAARAPRARERDRPFLAQRACYATRDALARTCASRACCA